MFKEVLQIEPKISTGDLNAMEHSLNSRFTNIAKKFGQGIMKVLTGGGIAGIALGLIEKVLNPLKEIQELIDTTLHRSDSLSTMAEHFNTESGKLFKLQQLAKANGMDPEMLNMLLGKFSNKIDEAIHDPKMETSVRKYALPGIDKADAFFEFIQNMQKLKPEEKTVVQEDVFGERRILGAAKFFGQKDFAGQSKALGLKSADAYTALINKNAELYDISEEAGVQRDTKKFTGAMQKTNIGQIRQKNAVELIKDARDVQRIAAYDRASKLDADVETVKSVLQDILIGSGSIDQKMGRVVSSLEGMASSKLLRGFIKNLGGIGN